MSAPDKDAPPSPPGRIITFYSYKGGTGRSMALANLGWLLASNGRRVLTIDWDLEAPGLHRYYRPFLADPELAETPGLIDFFVNVMDASRREAANPSAETSTSQPWFHDAADLARYAVAVEHDFPDGGFLDLVCAGQQGPSYGRRVNTFPWNDLYEKLHGGILLEATKAQLRERYDFVLIDSRTGLSDTSGICTVQMPDELVVCFTLNRQSMFGAAAAAGSADSQRRLASGAQALRIWPVPTRVELNEKDRLETARQTARELFAPFLWQVPIAQRTAYWGEIEMLYHPYYAYEEILATIADRPQLTASLLGSVERLASRLTDGAVTAMPTLEPGRREELLARYQPPRGGRDAAPARTPRFFISYASADNAEPTVQLLADTLTAEFGREVAFWSRMVRLGEDFTQTLQRQLDEAQAVIVVVGSRWGQSTGSNSEVRQAMSQGKPVIPVFLPRAPKEQIPNFLLQRYGVHLRRGAAGKDDLQDFVTKLFADYGGTKSTAPAAPIDVDDPHKGQFGGASERGGCRLTAVVNRTGDRDWFEVKLSVEGDGLSGDVEFHLHPSFRPAVQKVEVSGKVATLRLQSWGAFTVGAVADGGRTRLELDLAKLEEAPRRFRER